MIIKVENIPKWISDTSLHYETLISNTTPKEDSDNEEDSEIFVPDIYFKLTSNIENLDEYKNVLNVILFWQISNIPLDVYKYININPVETIFYIFSKELRTDIDVDKYHLNRVNRKIKGYVETNELMLNKFNHIYLKYFNYIETEEFYNSFNEESTLILSLAYIYLSYIHDKLILNSKLKINKIFFNYNFSNLCIKYKSHLLNYLALNKKNIIETPFKNEIDYDIIRNLNDIIENVYLQVSYSTLLYTNDSKEFIPLCLDVDLNILNHKLSHFSFAYDVTVEEFLINYEKLYINLGYDFYTLTLTSFNKNIEQEYRSKIYMNTSGLYISIIDGEHLSQYSYTINKFTHAQLYKNLKEIKYIDKN